MAFPSSPTVGATFTDASGQGWIYTSYGTWDRTTASFLLSDANMLSGNYFGAAPSVGIGQIGDYAEDTTNGFVYGPKGSGGWPATPVRVPADGNAVCGSYGGSAPSSSVGKIGDYAFDLDTGYSWGPKGSGGWPSTFKQFGASQRGVQAFVLNNVASPPIADQQPQSINLGSSAASNTDYTMTLGGILVKNAGTYIIKFVASALVTATAGAGVALTSWMSDAGGAGNEYAKVEQTGDVPTTGVNPVGNVSGVDNVPLAANTLLTPVVSLFASGGTAFSNLSGTGTIFRLQ